MIDLDGDWCNECCDGFITSMYFMCSKCGKKSTNDRCLLYAGGEEVDIEFSLISDLRDFKGKDLELRCEHCKARYVLKDFDGLNPIGSSSFEYTGLENDK